MKDNFEDFLNKEIRKSSIQIPDNGFSDRVISNLPERKSVFVDRKTIIILSTIISAFVFLLINGFNLLISMIINLFNSLIYLKTPNYEFVIMLLAFFLISLIIPYVELRKRVL